MGQATKQAAPSVYGRYETLFRIAAGGMAEVYAARVRGEAGFQKLVALKRMLPHLTDDERFVTMFMDEGRLAANISSPNVVSTLDLGRADDGSLYLVMELVVGTTLSTLLRNFAKEGVQVPIAVAVELIAQAAQGLHDAHDARTPFGAPLHIVHRDVSPQNILVGTDGRVRITDFGVARAILRRTKTSTGEFKGKLSYFSPEQCADRNLDRRSDIFSLGVVAWETFTTRRLFHAENPLAVLERVTRMPIPPANQVNPEVPPAIAAVLAMALERDRDARFGTAAEFAQALRKAGRETAGAVERGKVAELVTQFGGESLEKMQRQLRKSFADPSTVDTSSIEESKTEISSGIVFRNEDGEVMPATPHAPGSADPRAATQPMSPFHLPEQLSSHEMVEARPASKLPYVIAAAVAILGLGAGAVIGIVAASSDRQAIDVRQLPPDDTVEAPAVESFVDVEPAAVIEEPAVDAEQTPPPPVADRERRPARRPRDVAPPPVPEVRPLVEAQPEPPAEREPPPRPIVRREQPAPQPQPLQQQQQQPRPPGPGSTVLRPLDF
jgi:serine/threonine protein kinase